MKTNLFFHTLKNYFISYLPEVKGLSQNTIRAYQYAFQLLFEFFYREKDIYPEKITFDLLNEKNIQEFLLWLEKERHCSIATRNFRRSALYSFAKYAIKNSNSASLAFYSAMNNIPNKRTPKKSDIKYFTKDEISLLLNLPNKLTPIGRRDTVLLSLLYASGARAQELCDLRVNDIWFEKTTKLRLTGKGNKSRMIVIPENCALLLKKYLNSIQVDYNSPQDRMKHIFSSQTHEKMSISCVEAIVKKYVFIAKEKYPNLFQYHYSPHSFRHSIAVHMLECGESLVVIKAFLGHESITTTTIYASVTPELANKYLKERGRPLETVSKMQDYENPILSNFPFLKTKN